MRAYELVGFKPLARYRFADAAAEIDRVACSVVDDIIIELRGRGVNASFLHELYLLTLSGGLTVAVAVARAVSDGTTKARRWEVRKLKYQKADLTLLIRMDTGNLRIKDYFLLPTAVLPLTKDRKKLRVSDRLFGQMRLDSFEAVLTALYYRLHSTRTEQTNSLSPLIQRESRTSPNAAPSTLRRPMTSRTRSRTNRKTGPAAR